MTYLRPDVRVLPSVPDLNRTAAGFIADVVRASITERGVCVLALSGGRTPRPVYELLSSEPLRSTVMWERVHLLFADERAVPPDDLQSNFGMVHAAFLDGVDIPASNVHRIAGETDPEAAAADYEEKLHSLRDAGMDRCDLVVLGVGEDGHTASLFPGVVLPGAEPRLVRALYVTRLSSWRITLTPSYINEARNILFLVSGKEKAPVVSELLAGGASASPYPASRIQPRDGSLVWMMDSAAASLFVQGAGRNLLPGESSGGIHGA